MQRHIQSVLPSRPQNWPHPAALTSPLSALSAFRLYANKARGWREEGPETGFVIKCTQHLSCCFLLMFRFQHFNSHMNEILLTKRYSMYTLSIKADCKRLKTLNVVLEVLPPNSCAHCISVWRTLSTLYGAVHCWMHYARPSYMCHKYI